MIEVTHIDWQKERWASISYHKSTKDNHCIWEHPLLTIDLPMELIKKYEWWIRLKEARLQLSLGKDTFTKHWYHYIPAELKDVNYFLDQKRIACKRKISELKNKIDLRVAELQNTGIQGEIFEITEDSILVDLNIKLEKKYMDQKELEEHPEIFINEWNELNGKGKKI